MTTLFRWPSRRHVLQADDRGSLMLAMMAGIVVSGLVVATLAMVLVGQRRTREDQAFTGTIQGADAGIQDAFVTISELPSTTTATSLQNQAGVKVGKLTYTWTATRSSASGIAWNVVSTSTGTYAGQSSTRTVTATISQSPLFPMAAFANSNLNFNGNNAAVSYPTTGYGIVGTNGTMTLKGSSTTVDGVSLYNTDTMGTTGRCTGVACPPVSSMSLSPAPIQLQQAVSTNGFITQQLDACKQASGGTLTAFVGSSIPASATPYCFSSFYADTNNFTVTGDPNLSAIVYVDGGDVTLGNQNHSTVNYDVPSQPNSIRLRIYTTGSTVNVYNQGNVSAAIYAPNAACSGATSNAQTDFWGSMMCNTIDNVGGWTFHYDTRLSALGDGTWHIRSYSEP